MFSRFCPCMGRSRIKLEEPEHRATTDVESVSKDLGLFTLNETAEDTEYEVDVVAIHGLGGDWQGTWTADNGRLWLRDFLPAEVQNARMFSYGYNSQIAFTKSVADISDVARMLLDSLKGERKGAAVTRPLVFISHSLGGIIVKKALVIAHERSGVYGDLLSSVRGSVFFGVPHRGSDVAYWGLFAANLLKYAQLGFGTNTKFVEALGRNSHEFADICDQFIERGANLKIRTFYETEKMGNQLIVDRESACLKVINEVAIGIAANHRTMCKFDNAKSQKYIPVRNAVTELIEVAIEATTASHTTSTEEAACLQCLYTSDYQSHKRRNPSRVAGTCEWFFNHSKYLTWKEAERSSLLWLSADPGCGKSVLSSFLIDELKATQTSSNIKSIVCYFFFKDDSDAQKNAPNALSAILYQLCEARPQLLRFPLEEYRKKSEKFVNEVETLWKLILSATAQKDCGTVICVLDGLDECQADSRRLLLDVMVDFYSAQPTGQAQREDRQLKFMVTSRPYSDIERRFHKLSTIRLKAEDETASVSGDIARVVRARVEELGSSKYRLTISAQTELCQRLIRNADHTFLWVSLILHIIETSSFSLPALDQAITKIPSSLNAIYEKILAQSTDVASAKKLLHIIVAAVEPMSVQQLNVAFSIDKRHQSFANLKKDLEPDIVTTIKDLCGSFVRVIDGRVYLVHQTAREFLVNFAAKAPIEPNRWKHSIDTFQSNTILASSCILVLQLQENAVDGSFEEHKGEEIEQTATTANTEPMRLKLYFGDFLRYAGAHWHLHLRGSDAKPNDSLCRSASLLCDPRSKAFKIWSAVSGPVPEYRTGTFITNINQDFGFEETSLTTAALYGLNSLVIHLLQTLSHNTSEHRGAALIVAARAGYLDVAKTLIEQGTDCFRLADKHEKTSLGYAIWQKHTQLAQMLIENGAPINTVCWWNGTTPLHLAVYFAQTKVTETLLRHGAAVDAVDSFGMTAVMMMENCTPTDYTYYNPSVVTEMLRILLRAGANLEHRDHDGRTPLIRYLEVLTSPRSEIIPSLVEKGASTRDVNGRTVAKALGASLMRERDNNYRTGNYPHLKVFMSLHNGVGRPLLRYGVEGDDFNSVGYGRAGALYTRLYAHGKLHGYTLIGPHPKPSDEDRFDRQAWVDVLRLMKQMNVLTVQLPGAKKWRWKTRDELYTHHVQELEADEVKPLLVLLGDCYMPYTTTIM